jgi:hypothetical protein
MIYMHLLTWVGFGLLGYIPNTFYTYKHTARALFPKGQQRHLRYSSEKSTFYQNYSAMRNTIDVIGGKPIAV